VRRGARRKRRQGELAPVRASDGLLGEGASLSLTPGWAERVRKTTPPGDLLVPESTRVTPGSPGRSCRGGVARGPPGAAFPRSASHHAPGAIPCPQATTPAARGVRGGRAALGAGAPVREHLQSRDDLPRRSEADDFAERDYLRWPSVEKPHSRLGLASFALA